MKPEAKVWKSVRRCIPRDVWAKRIEDASGDLGTFDTLLMRNGGLMWIELKAGGPEARPDMRRGQPAFGAKCKVHGVPAFVLMGHPDGSAKIMEGDTVGKDWREKLCYQWDTISKDHVCRLLEENGLTRNCNF